MAQPLDDKVQVQDGDSPLYSDIHQTSGLPLIFGLPGRIPPHSYPAGPQVLPLLLLHGLALSVSLAAIWALFSAKSLYQGAVGTRGSPPPTGHCCLSLSRRPASEGLVL